ncbi:hypothetical protein ACRQ5Q_15345 [Bradyrhizobium sp. PMVTL-01]|uniref:hypothetical protein n=1 Tax=Bradyrhizobium sp. PMVTL-01 TaxID=3434999 RepID=UPI003F71C593
MPVTHFVGFPDLGHRYHNAVRVFGKPAFLHRFWDQRAKREIAEGDVVVFAEGDEHRPVRKWNGDDQFYTPDLPEPKGEL